MRRFTVNILWQFRITHCPAFLHKCPGGRCWKCHRCCLWLDCTLGSQLSCQGGRRLRAVMARASEEPAAVRCQVLYSSAHITLTQREAERDHDSRSTYRSQTENKPLFKSSVLQEPVGLDFPNNKLTFLSAFMHNTPLQNYPQQIPAVFSFHPSAPHSGCCYKFPNPLVMMLLFLFND